MIHVKDVVKKTGVSTVTLQRYRDMGMIGYPKIEYHGRGREAYYDEEVVSIIEFIEVMKTKGYKLHEIRDMLAKRRDEEKDLMTSEPNPDELTWGADIFQHEEANLRQQGRELIRAELVKRSEKLDGTVNIHLRLVTVPKENK